ncbi:MAG TPA: hypothetical protein VEE84_07780 [Burkholderiaceae bacterium]|nr:hypothetical protein [Burkholderiaceae bacterium]
MTAAADLLTNGPTRCDFRRQAGSRAKAQRFALLALGESIAPESQKRGCHHRRGTGARVRDGPLIAALAGAVGVAGAAAQGATLAAVCGTFLM